MALLSSQLIVKAALTINGTVIPAGEYEGSISRHGQI
jgi:hypothetical protein